MEERILIGLDDSDESWIAFEYGIELAKEVGAEKITAVHSEEGGDKTDLEEYRTGEEILEEAENRGEKEGIRVDTNLLVRGLDPDEDIVKFAEENNINHLIVGHRGRSSVARALLGSVAEGVVEKSHCAVTVVRGVCPISE